jgi:hypothetical protein
MIIAVMARDVISYHRARDRANWSGDYAASDSATHKSGLIGHSGTRESERHNCNAGQDNSIEHAKNPSIKLHSIVSLGGEHWFHGASLSLTVPLRLPRKIGAGRIH